MNKTTLTLSPTPSVGELLLAAEGLRLFAETRSRLDVRITQIEAEELRLVAACRELVEGQQPWFLTPVAAAELIAAWYAWYDADYSSFPADGPASHPAFRLMRAVRCCAGETERVYAAWRHRIHSKVFDTPITGAD